MELVALALVVAQNTTGTQGHGVHPCPPEFVANQVRKPCYIINFLV